MSIEEINQRYPIYDGLLIGSGKTQDTPIPDHLLKSEELRGEKPVVQDKVYVYRPKHVFGVADGITGAGQNSAKVAEYVVERMTHALHGAAMQHKDNYELIYRELEYLLLNVDVKMDSEYGATSTLVSGYITPDRKLLTYRVGDSETRIIRNKEIYHIDELTTWKDNEKLFYGKFLIPEFERGTRKQAKEYNAPNQIGNSMAKGRLTMHQLEYGDRIIFSSDGFNKSFGDRVEETIYRIVSNAQDPISAEDKLINTAVNRGLRDDYSAVVIFNNAPSRKAIFEHKLTRFFDKLKGK